jgi:hypothetical protein
MLTDLAVQIGAVIAWTCITGMLALTAYCTWEMIREARAWRRLERRIGRIGVEQTRARTRRDDE